MPEFTNLCSFERVVAHLRVEVPRGRQGGRVAGVLALAAEPGSRSRWGRPSSNEPGLLDHDPSEPLPVGLFLQGFLNRRRWQESAHLIQKVRPRFIGRQVLHPVAEGVSELVVIPPMIADLPRDEIDRQFHPALRQPGDR